MRLHLGDVGERAAWLDLDLLLRTRLLVQASSGGGKSWLLRRLAEQAFGHVPIVIIDPEGEFATLRERHDFLIVGKGGDTPATIKTAPILARRILETGISAVCDVFELNPPQRSAWVAAFLGALDTAPKETWRDLIVIVDEAHMFAPEKGTRDTACLDAVMALATRGRKRGFCAVLATQRLGKLNKDVAAELQNVLIGRTVLDTDRDRSAEALGIGRAGRAEFDKAIKRLGSGRFYALGRAVVGGDADALEVQVGPVTTTHPEPGKRRALTPPPPTTFVRDLLAKKFSDLPAEVDREASLVANLRAELETVKAQLRSRPPEIRTVTVEVIPDWVLEHVQAIAKKGRLLEEHGAALESAAGALADRLVATLNAAAGRGIEDTTRALNSGHEAIERTSTPKPVRPSPGGDPKNGALVRGALRILAILKARHPERLTADQLAALAVMTKTGGTYSTYMGKLVGLGYVDREGGTLGVTEAGRAVSTPPPPPVREVVAEWKTKLIGKARDVFETLTLEHEVGVEDLCKRFDMTKSGGTWSTYRGKMVGLGIVRPGRGTLKIHPELAL